MRRVACSGAAVRQCSSAAALATRRELRAEASPCVHALGVVAAQLGPRQRRAHLDGVESSCARRRCCAICLVIFGMHFTSSASRSRECELRRSVVAERRAGRVGPLRRYEPDRTPRRQQKGGCGGGLHTLFLGPSRCPLRGGGLSVTPTLKAKKQLFHPSRFGGLVVLLVPS